MKTLTRDEIFDHVLKAEGGFVDHPSDSGGATNFGVTQKTLDEFMPGKKVKDLTKADAKEIYYKRYWQPMKLDELDGSPDIQLCLFDQGINRGVNSALKQAQETLNDLGENLYIDGIIGPITIGAMKVYNSKQFCRIYLRKSFHFYIGICRKRNDQLVFLVGWCDRVLNLIDAIR